MRHTTPYKQQNGYIVLLNLASGIYQPTFHDDNGLMFFMDEKSAQLEIKDCIDSVLEAIEAGDMDADSELTNDDYTIVPATVINPYAEPEHQTIVCYLDGEQYVMKRSADDWTNTGSI